MKMLLATSFALSAALTGAMAQEMPYLDNRTDAASLVTSLYNAINRKEYARAWDYFGEQKPSRDFDTFVKGYATTGRVLVATGAITSEGAAGSTFFQVPVAIAAFDADGNDEKVFAGCYTARLANPQIQGTPFAPLHLESGSLSPADGPLLSALPERCGDAALGIDPKQAALQLAKSKFAASYSETCQTLEPDAETGAAEPEVHDIEFRYATTPESDPPSSVTLYRFGCNLGAYNTGEVYYIADTIGEVRQLQFAEPDLDIRYQDPGTNAKLESMTIIGYETTDQLVNSFYDENEKSLTSFAKWRGVGDTSSTGKYIFREGEFVLVHYEVDPTEDEEINGQVVLDFDTGP